MPGYNDVAKKAKAKAQQYPKKTSMGGTKKKRNLRRHRTRRVKRRGSRRR